METLLQYYLQLANLTKDNPILATGLGVGIVSFLFMTLRRLPGQLGKLIASQSTTQLYMHNAGYWANLLLFQSFMAWYISTPWSRFSRKMSVETSDSREVVVGPGFGLHFFFYKGTFCWFNKASIDKPHSTSQDESITLHALTRNKQILADLIEEFKPKKTPDDQVPIFRMNSSGEWYLATTVLGRPLDTVIIDAELKAEIVEAIDSFFKERDWYILNNVAHKLTALFKGPPGTGKTSLIKALCHHFRAPLHLINISDCSDGSFAHAIESLPRGAFALIEDVDSTDAVKSRGVSKFPTNKVDPNQLSPAPAEPTKEKSSDLNFFRELSLTGVLNTLDGVVTIDGVVLFLTTNHPEKLDEALTREGRVDLNKVIPYLKDVEIKQYIQRIYGPVVLDQYTFTDTPGCVLHGLLTKHKRNVDGFMQELLIKQFGEPPVLTERVPNQKPEQAKLPLSA